MKVCRKCGSALRDGDKFCSKCGAKVPSGIIAKKREKARKNKLAKEVTFRTKPAQAGSYRENFEEGENRSHALLVTVTILMVMMVTVALIAIFFFMRKRYETGGAGFGDAIKILTNESNSSEIIVQDPSAEGAAAEAAAPAEGTGEAAAAEGATAEAAAPAEGTGEAAAAEGVAAEAQSESGAGQPETETEPQTEPQTEPMPDAASVIDPAQIQSIITNESTALSSEVYVYDLLHDSEAALNDVNEPMYASALITVPILYTAASRIDAGSMSMDEPIVYKTSIGGRGEMTTELRDGLEFPLSFYLQTMTNYSDNNCINILIDYIGLDTINATCREAGYSTVNMERGLVATDPGGLDNYVSAKDLTMMVKDLFTGKFQSVGTDYMRNYFHISDGDSLPTLFGRAPSLADATALLNQNGHGMTRYNETAVIEDNGASYILTVMLYGQSGLAYEAAATDVAEYVNTVMTQKS